MTTPVSGSVIVKCKNPDCSENSFTGDFVFNLEAWHEGFKDQKIECPTCKQKHEYTKSDLILIPSKQ